MKDSQKTVQFQPYYVNGNDKEVYDTTGLISGTSAQVLEAGKWTKFEGTYKIPSGAKKVVIRILEQEIGMTKIPVSWENTMWQMYP